MTHPLLDELFPLRAAELLREQYGHQATHVAEFGLDATDDADIATFARANDWAMVTENVSDFARESDLVLVFVLERNLPAGGAQAAAFAELLDRWIQEHPDPYLGAHWPT
ncbi:MAG: DUF5615 family PIN-like protein [Nitriliruptor sp.]|uniref:DUF5615 family PIN-like protein n=1 Tax=Nitriliruptor sp. TaxID=2448056 RepID=UPI00349FE386